MRILIIDPDGTFSMNLKWKLMGEINAKVEDTDSGEEGLELAKLYDFDIIVMELIQTDMVGFTLLRKLRESVKTPVMVVSHKASEIETRIQALKLGADDAMVKPVHWEEVAARATAIARRAAGFTTNKLKFGDGGEVDLDKKTVSVHGKPMHLTSKEFQVMELLLMRRTLLVKKDSFLNHLYGGLEEPEPKIVDVFICNLRKKMSEAMGGKHYIHTTWGQGYSLRDEPVMENLTRGYRGVRPMADAA